MIKCDWQKHGCTRIFNSIYAVRVHQRSCLFRHTSSIKKRKRKELHHSSIATSISQLRFHCDKETFGRISHKVPTAAPENLYDDNSLVSYVMNHIQDQENRTALDTGGNIAYLATSAMVMLARFTRKVGKGAEDELINLSTSQDFPNTTFKRLCQSSKNCIKMESSLVENDLSIRGFSRIVVHDNDHDIQCDLYIKSPVTVLSTQIKGASKYSTLFNSPPSTTEPTDLTHPMNSLLGRNGEKCVRKAVMSSITPGVMWHDGNLGAQSSFAGMIQLYSDKSTTSLKQSSFQFYTMHATLLSFSEEYRRHCIVHGMTVIAFLPVKFFRKENGILIQQNLKRFDYLFMLHKCMGTVLHDSRESSYLGFPCIDAEGMMRRCHPVISNYCCNLPESHDIIPINNGNSSKLNCHRCNTLTENFSTFSPGNKRTGMDTIALLKQLQDLRKGSNRKQCNAILFEHSLVEFFPFLHGFPFIGLDPVLDMLAIFSFEPLHNLHLGISKLLKQCMADRLQSTVLETSAIPSKGGKCRTSSFRSVRMKILASVSKLLSHIQRYSPIIGVRVDFSKSGSNGQEKGLYGPDGTLIGMLEGKDYRSIDMVFPFVGMMVDRACGEVGTAVTTRLFVLYSEIVQLFLSHTQQESVLWNERKLNFLQHKIQNFKKTATQLYSDHHASDLCTTKMHMLDHIVDDIRRFGGLRYCDASLYEYSHTMVKSAHRATSRRRNSAMTETIAIYTKDRNQAARNGSSVITNSESREIRVANNQKNIPVAKQAAKIQDCATLVTNSKNFSLSDIERTRGLLRKKRIAQQNGQIKLCQEVQSALHSVPEDVRQLVEDMGETASRTYYREVSSVCFGSISPPMRQNRIIVRKVASGYVSGILTPTIRHYNE